MTNFLFDTSHWPPRWHCGQWTSALGYTHIISDILIFLAYFTIPLILVYCYFKIKGFALERVFALFALFIVCCGSGHLIEAIIFTYPVYRFAGLVKAITAIVSWLTVVALIPYIKKLALFPQLIVINKELNEKKDELNALLQKTNEDLEQHKEALEEFSYHVAHDLKEPVRGMGNYATILLNDPDYNLQENAKKPLEKILTLSTRSLEMVDNMLRYAKDTKGEDQKSLFEIEQMVNELIEEVQNPQNRCLFKIQKELPKIYANPTSIKEVFRNLLTNAIKYNDKGEKLIEVGHREDALKHIFFVKDNGTGIPEKEQKNVFRLFFRGTNSTQKNSNGLGLGISKKYIERAGGNIWLESEEGKGTTFFFSVPKGDVNALGIPDEFSSRDGKTEGRTHSHC